MSASYAEAGVDIDKGEELARFIRGMDSPAIPRQVGGYAGSLPVNLSEYSDPVVLSTTDGVGTKLLIARELGVFNTVGIDLVAMSVNDLAVCGVPPAAFLDYIACGNLNLDIMKEVIRGIVAGCEEAECKLTGGETAEQPGMYGEDEFDLAGFAIGVAERSQILPRMDEIRPGDRIFGLPSTGVHSNGFSLARKVLPLDSREVLEELLTPTRIYVRDLKILGDSGLLQAAAHITGGGLTNNIPRVLPPETRARLFFDWPVPRIFTEIQDRGDIHDEEMRRVFNLGIGVALVVSKDDADRLAGVATASGIRLLEIGEVAGG